MRGVFSFFLFFCSTHCLTLGIYNGRIQGHVNRFNHVQSVFARPPAPSLSRSHTLSHTLKHSHTLPLSPSPSPSLLCLTASSYHSLSCSPIPAAVFPSPSHPRFSSPSPSVSFAHSRSVYWREAVALPHSFSCSLLLLSSLSSYYFRLPLSPLHSVSAHCHAYMVLPLSFASTSLVFQSPSELTCHSVIVSCHLWY